LTIPSTADGTRIFVDLTVETSAILEGDENQHEDPDIRSDDPDQTCQEALRTMAIDVIDSVAVVSPAEVETTLGITPASATVRRGESVDLTVEASDVQWVELLVTGGEEFEYWASLAVGDETTTLRVAPPTDGPSSETISATEGGRLEADIFDDFVPGDYSVVIRAPGTNGLVSASTNLTVEPAG